MISSSKETFFVKIYYHSCIYILEVAHYFPFGTSLKVVGIREKTAEDKGYNVLFALIK